MTRRSSFCAFILLSAGCAQPPTRELEISAARVEAARERDAAVFAPELFAEAESSLAKAERLSANEGDSGTTTFDFTVSLSVPAGAGGVTFDIATADNTANASSDYVAKALTGQAIPAGSSTYTFGVTVNGDTAPEPHEI